MSRINVNSTGKGSMSHSDQSELDMVKDDSYSPASDVDNLNLTETAEDSLPSAGAVVIEAGKKGEEQIQKWIRVQEYDSWIWNSFYLDLNVVKYGKRSYLDSLARCKSCHDLYWRDERHCKICHMTFELDFDLEERYAIHIATCREKEDSNTFPALFLPEFGLFFSLALLCCSVLFPEIKVILLQQRCCMFMHACVSLLTDCWES